MSVSPAVAAAIAATLKTEFDSDPSGLGYKTGVVEADGYRPTRRKGAEPGLLQLLQFTPMITNPAAVPQIPEPWNQDMFIGEGGLVTAVQLNAIVDQLGEPFLRSLLDAIITNDRPQIYDKLLLVYRMGLDPANPILSQATVDALLVRYNQTYDDPAHPATIAGKSRFTVLSEAAGWLELPISDGTTPPVRSCEEAWIETARIL